MDENYSLDLTPQLQLLMQPAGINSFKQLAQIAGTSTQTIRKLRSGKLATLRWQTLINLSIGLQISVRTLLEIFGAVGSEHLHPKSATDTASHQLATLQQEYHHLQQQLAQQQITLQTEFQYQSLQTLESFLTYFPTAKHAAINQPDFPASKLLPLVTAIDRLITNWGVTIIGHVGESIGYDPQWHHLIDGNAHPGDTVTVRYLGYKQHDRLLFRAKVSVIDKLA